MEFLAILAPHSQSQKTRNDKCTHILNKYQEQFIYGQLRLLRQNEADRKRATDNCSKLLKTFRVNNKHDCVNMI